MTIKDDTLIKIATMRKKDLEQMPPLNEFNGAEEFVGWCGFAIFVQPHEPQ